eukprot:TRINITY_DN37906_c0_g1_i2.p1 TRINITY_DN37906_c0_g1~~TRINITY_DN37906_c0_g1_i2.p1  ORF type:complete len:138 (-),score=16.07 TRINITY_DN37906_c0_g1_i2:31-387(-)
MNGQFKGLENHVLKQICKKQNKKGYYQMRLLNNLHKSGFEDSIDSACVDYKNLQKFSESKFSYQIKFLIIQIPFDSDRWDLLRFISTKYLPKIEKVDATVIHSHEYNPKKCIIKKILI